MDTSVSLQCSFEGIETSSSGENTVDDWKPLSEALTGALKRLGIEKGPGAPELPASCYGTAPKVGGDSFSSAHRPRVRTAPEDTGYRRAVLAAACGEANPTAARRYLVLSEIEVHSRTLLYGSDGLEQRKEQRYVLLFGAFVAHERTEALDVTLTGPRPLDQLKE